jgi:Rrf2 family protein
MHLSKRGEYGLRAMINLASRTDQHQLVHVKLIAEQEKIPLKFLEQILLTLRNAGLVNSKAGRGGGYSLGQAADQITLGRIVRALDGPIAPIKCVSQMAYEPCACPDEETCGLRMIMGDVRNAVSAILDRTTLADVARRVEVLRESA